MGNTHLLSLGSGYLAFNLGFDALDGYRVLTFSRGSDILKLSNRIR